MIKNLKAQLKVNLPAWMTCPKMSFLYRMVLCVTWFYVKLFHRHRVVGRKNIPDGACLIASNHVSFLDPPLVAISVSSEIHFLARDTLFKPRFFGGFIRRLNCHPLRREGSDITAIKTIMQLLANGEKVLVFPQGTRSASYEIGDLKGGIYFIASKAKVKVVPTFVAGPLEIWPRNAKRPKLFGKTACLFGEPVEVNTSLDPDKAQAEFLKTLKDRMNGLGAEAQKLLRPR